MKKRILVVDDERGMLLVTSRQLRNAGYEVEIASSGRDAIEKSRRGGYDLVVMDVKMPGMDGIEALREMPENTAVVLYTGFATLRRGDPQIPGAENLTELLPERMRVQSKHEQGLETSVARGIESLPAWREFLKARKLDTGRWPDRYQGLAERYLESRKVTDSLYKG